MTTMSTTKTTPSKPRKSRKVSTRSLEGDYLAKMADCCDMDTWTDIVLSTVTQAKEGDFRARDFLARWLLPKDKSLIEIAYEEKNGVTAEKQVEDFKPNVIK